MLKSGVRNHPDVNRMLHGEFNIQEDGRTYSQLLDYAEFRGFDPPNEMELSAISEGLSAGFPKPSWLTLRHHLFRMRVPKKVFPSTIGGAMNDKKDEFEQERLFRGWLKYIYRKLPTKWRQWIFL